ncbi:MAG: exosome complex RNA-binding protein Rrp4 [Candidatus Woesearchaeota archaeon]|jgi:exosome complex component RRP4|nr:exosome complex RNA-binding protein Rrp4 [Candidatus Woesearchaeota archaeon]MDP7610540.1 exosome complex RNA-binding protein Rrp4 [Candidatus Woesearchaeota archaeon]|tara:strand:+ start:1218 stop:1910 length:693 start_codon:yes stop_codon:yes gene_type:complete
MSLLIKDKDIVVPGEELAKGIEYSSGYGTYKDKEGIVASKLGLVNIRDKEISLVPLSGRYMPQRDDVIIGQIEDISFSGWRVDTGSAYSAMLSVRDATSEYINKGADLTRFYDLGDYIVTKILNVTSQKLIDLTMKGPGLRKLVGGRIIEVNAHKVPRIIGKAGSMVSLIKENTNCKITVGQNGLIWIDGSPADELVAVNTIRKIEREAHISGLTDKIKAYLEECCKKNE